MIISSDNDNQIPESLYPALRFAKPRFSSYIPNYDPNISIPSETIDLQGLLNILKSMKGKESE